MSYRGRLSNGCAPCRAKRTKCDQARPLCGQCLRAGRTCSGYRNLAELQFVNQTQTVIGKKRARVSPSIPSDALSLCMAQSARSTPEPYFISPALLDSLDFQATCYFVRNYSWQGTQASKGFFDYLPEIINAQGSVGSALMDAVISLGLAGISHTKSNNSSVIIAAKEKYNRAVSATNSALCTEEAKADQTLITVMLLGLFEINTCDTPRSMKSWTQHINGATQILQLRGIEQLQTHTGHRIFVQLRSQIIINSIQRRARIPDIITSWSLMSLPNESGEELTASKLALLVMEFCNLRALMMSMHDYTNSAFIVSVALAIDAAFAAWAAENPYIYNTVHLTSRSDAVFADYYHTYSSILIASSWNSYRSVRILLNELLLAQLNHLSQSQVEDISADPAENDTSHLQQQYRSQLLHSRAVLVQLTQDICASVPFFLCDAPSPPDELPQPAQPPRAVCGNLLLWPLYTAACTDLVSGVMQAWVVQRLEKIADVMGVQQARSLAILLCLRKDPPAWRDMELMTVQEDGSADEW